MISGTDGEVKAVDIEVSTSWETWPALRDETRLLHPGAALIGLHRDGELVGVLRRYVGDGSRWLARWPTGESDREPPAPSVHFSADSNAHTAEAWFELEGLDGEDHLVARAVLTPRQPPTWIRRPPDGTDGLVVEALAELLVESGSTDAGDEIPLHEVIALRGPHVPGLHADLGLRSWHVTDGRRILRAVELPPLRDPDDDVVRARRARIIASTAPLSAPGFLLWKDGEVSLWRGGEEPLLDPPLAPRDHSALEGLLVEHLDTESLEF